MLSDFRDHHASKFWHFSSLSGLFPDEDVTSLCFAQQGPKEPCDKPLTSKGPVYCLGCASICQRLPGSLQLVSQLGMQALSQHQALSLYYLPLAMAHLSPFSSGFCSCTVPCQMNFSPPAAYFVIIALPWHYISSFD